MVSNTSTRRTREKKPIHLRKRVPVACEKCRLSKSKCTGGYPCLRCRMSGSECQIVPVQRSIKSKEDHIDELDLLRNYNLKLERIIRHLYPNITLKFLKKNIDTVERMICVNDGNVPRQAKEDDFLNLLVNDSDDSRKLKSNLASTKDDSFLSYLQPLTDVSCASSHNSYHTTSFGSECILNALKQLPEDEDIIRLNEIFFNICETNYFYVDPSVYWKQIHWLLKAKSINQVYEISKNWKFLVTLLAVLSIATGYDYIGHKTTLPVITNSMIGLEDPGKPFYEVCVPFIGDLVTCNDIQSAQALLLLGIFLTTNEPVSPESTIHGGYLFIRTAAEMAISRGLHQIKDIRCADDEFRIRFWWSCYCLERRYAITLCKPPVIDKDQIISALPSDCSQLRGPGGISNYKNQKAIVELTFLTNKISDVMSGGKAAGGIGDYVILNFSHVRQLLFELQRYEESYSISCAKDLDCDLPLYRANFHLQLHYLLAKLYLGKPFLLFKIESLNSNTPLDDNEKAFIDHMSSVCLDSAFKMIELLATLQEKQKLGLYSSTDVNFCKLALFVIAIFFKIDKSKSTRIFMDRGLRILETLSKGCNNARLAYLRFSKIDTNITCKPGNDAWTEDSWDHPKSLHSVNSLTPIEAYNQNDLMFYIGGLESTTLPEGINFEFDGGEVRG